MTGEGRRRPQRPSLPVRANRLPSLAHARRARLEHLKQPAGDALALGVERKLDRQPRGRAHERARVGRAPHELRRRAARPAGPPLALSERWFRGEFEIHVEMHVVCVRARARVCLCVCAFLARRAVPVANSKTPSSRFLRVHRHIQLRRGKKTQLFRGVSTADLKSTVSALFINCAVNFDRRPCRPAAKGGTSLFLGWLNAVSEIRIKCIPSSDQRKPRCRGRRSPRRA